MKHTAVEWLEIQLFKKQGKFNKSDIEQAKAMEKEQIIEAWDKRGNIIVPRYFLEENINGEQYYNETFKAE